MSAISANIINRQCSINEKLEKSYTHVYQVLTDSPADNEITAMLAVPVAIADQLGIDPTTYLRNKSATLVGRTNQGQQWEVSLEYGSGEPETSAPWDQTPDYSWSLAAYEREVTEDINGKPIVNAVGDPFQDQLLIDDSRAVLSITYNTQSFDPSLAWEYRDKVNQSSFYGAPAKTVKLKNCSAVNVKDDVWGEYVTVSAEFEFNPDGWKKKILNVGMRYKDDSGNIKKILVNGTEAQEPLPLDKDGKLIPQGTPPEFLEFEVYHAVSFGVFE